jgi:hypothetical protein
MDLRTLLQARGHLFVINASPGRIASYQVDDFIDDYADWSRFRQAEQKACFCGFFSACMSAFHTFIHTLCGQRIAR